MGNSSGRSTESGNNKATVTIGNENTNNKLTGGITNKGKVKFCPDGENNFKIGDKNASNVAAFVTNDVDVQQT